MVKRRSLRTQFIAALGLASLVSVGFFGYGVWHYQSATYEYFIWNLFLAWLPLLFAAWLVAMLRRRLWSSWQAMGVTVLWLMFLPNSFYMISDFIHLQEIQGSDLLLYDALMFTSFIYVGVLLGFSSLYMVHLELKRRFSSIVAAGWMALTLLTSSFAIYLGRDLRWNSWDVLTNPGGLLFDISDRVLHPSAYPEMFITVISFFVLLLTMYGLAWRGIQLLRQQPVPRPDAHKF
jgi:uncharacterized membrane protein